MSTHAEDLKLRLMTIELLRTAKYKRNITYRELASKTGLPVTVLSRYAKGHVLPNTARAKQLWRVLTKLVGLETELRSRIKFDETGYFDNTEIIGDYNILQQAANHALANFAGKRVTKILTAAVDGIPLATMVANSLGVNLIVAKRNKEVGVKAFLERNIHFRKGFRSDRYSLHPQGGNKETRQRSRCGRHDKKRRNPRSNCKPCAKSQSRNIRRFLFDRRGRRMEEKIEIRQRLPSRSCHIPKIAI